MDTRRLFGWEGLALALFAVLLLACALLIEYTGSILILMSLRVFDFVVIALAAFRLTHLLTYDKIFDFVRDAFMDVRAGHEVMPRSTVRRLFAELLECIWCTGMWAAPIMLTAFSLGIWGRFIVYVFAIAGVAALIQIITSAIARSND